MPGRARWTVTAVQDTFDDDGETIGIKATRGVDQSAEQTVTIRDDDTFGLNVS